MAFFQYFLDLSKIPYFFIVVGEKMKNHIFFLVIMRDDIIKSNLFIVWILVAVLVLIFFSFC